MEQVTKSKREQLISKIEDAISNGNPVHLKNQYTVREGVRPFYFFKKFDNKEEAQGCADKIRMLLTYSARVRSSPVNERYSVYVRSAIIGKYSGR